MLTRRPLSGLARLACALAAVVFAAPTLARQAASAPAPSKQPAAAPAPAGKPTDAGAKPEAGKKRAPYFQLTIPPAITLAPPFSGRATIYLKREDAKVAKELGAGDGPFFDDPQPMFSMVVKDLKPGDEVKFVEEVWSHFPLKDLPNGKYQAMAVLDRERSHSSWRKEELNLNSPYRYFEIKDLKPGQDPPFVRFELVEASPTPLPLLKGVEPFEVDSSLLTAFRGAPTKLRAGVVLPVNYDAKKQYPVVYWIHAFPSTPDYTGDWRDAWYEGTFRQPPAKGRAVVRETHPLWQDAFYICLDAQGPNGHHLFADSDNNGPVGKALVEELIPALEKKYPLIAKPEARVLRGQSSGAWSAVWLAMNYPEVFGGAWATSPDPVDFRAFQATNIYEAKSMFVGPDGKDTPSYRVGDQVRLTVRVENAMERVLGPEGESGQQWASWMAAFGPKDPKTGFAKPLFNLQTGEIDRSVAEKFKRYDISALVRADPAKYGPIFRDRIRLIAGDRDNFYLNKAVELLRQELDKAKMLGAKSGPDAGYIEIRPGGDHGVIGSLESMNGLWGEIQAYFKAKGVTPK